MKAHLLWFVAAMLAIVAGFVTLSRHGDTWLAVAYIAAGLFLIAMGDITRRRGGGDAGR